MHDDKGEWRVRLNVKKSGICGTGLNLSIYLVHGRHVGYGGIYE